MAPASHDSAEDDRDRVAGGVLGIPIVLYRECNRIVWQVEGDYHRARAEEETNPKARRLIPRRRLSTNACSASNGHPRR